MTFGEKLKSIRLNRHMSQDDLSKILGTSKQVISRYENGLTTPKIDVAVRYAKKLHLPVNFLVDNAIETLHDAELESARAAPYKPTHKIPILGRIPAGAPMYADENIDGYTYTELNGGAEYFALRVQGDSMNAARIHDGDLLIVRRQSFVDNGQIAVVLVDGEDATVKIFSHDGDMITLLPQSHNPAHKPQIYSLSEHKIDVLGLVVEAKCKIN